MTDRGPFSERVQNRTGQQSLAGQRRDLIIDRLCESLADPIEQGRFLASEDAYCFEFGLRPEERNAVKRRDYIALISMGVKLRKLDVLASLVGLTALEAIKRTPLKDRRWVAILLHLDEV